MLKTPPVPNNLQHRHGIPHNGHDKTVLSVLYVDDGLTLISDNITLALGSNHFQIAQASSRFRLAPFSAMIS
ncbi:hypothetical protein IMZ48_36620 [Candidatus Bathyarchaeota archaeon]|nr:hypothetical protein [Candidatus Bathyarchaeota archaeon]